MEVHEKSNSYQILQFKQIAKNYMQQVNEIIKNQINTTSNRQ